MMVEAKQLMPITRLQKQLTQTVRDLSVSGNPVYILKNNNMEAVLLSYNEYEYLKEIEELFEQTEINNIIQKRKKNYDPKRNISWAEIRDDAWFMDIVFVPEAAAEYKSLDNSIRKLANKIIDKLGENPFLGEKLGNRNNINLTGFYKIYFAKNPKPSIPNELRCEKIYLLGKS